ncbi:unnamed protein product, partial [Allacma fusca]
MLRDTLIPNGFANFDILNGHFIFVFTGELITGTISDQVSRLFVSVRAFQNAVFLFLSQSKTQAILPSALKSGHYENVYDVLNSLNDTRLILSNKERLIKIDLEQQPVKALVCPLCDPTGDPSKVPIPLIFVFTEFISFINATPEYESVFAEFNSDDWITPLIDGTAA